MSDSVKPDGALRKSTREPVLIPSFSGSGVAEYPVMVYAPKAGPATVILVTVAELTGGPQTIVPMNDIRIVSGGQTGVDRGALDAALAAGAACGGWCPAGRRAEDGRIPPEYPLAETRESDYVARTRRNVEDSDATLIIHSGELEGGTALTVNICRELDRPHLVVNAGAESVADAADRLRSYIREHRVGTLNVAGPRASKWPEAEDTTRDLLSRILE